jgi:hypothetical protein
MMKAEEFVKRFSDEEFICSAGWLDRFKLHHNMSVGIVSGQAQGVNSDMTTEWLNALWPTVREGYTDTDEIGIFLD